MEDELAAHPPDRHATLSAKVLDSTGKVIQDLGVISESPEPLDGPPKADLPLHVGLLAALAGLIIMLLVIGLAKWVLLSTLFLVFGIVTNAGVAFEAAAFAGGSGVSAFNFHDSGTGTNAAAVTDTALQTATGIARVAGTQTTPGSTNVYQSVATITYTGTFAVTEWGIFSASSSGTLWDRRVFSAINVVNGNAIQFTYQLTIPSGGS
jgi:hypothetical protein